MTFTEYISNKLRFNITDFLYFLTLSFLGIEIEALTGVLEYYRTY